MATLYGGLITILLFLFIYFVFFKLDWGHSNVSDLSVLQKKNDILKDLLIIIDKKINHLESLQNQLLDLETNLKTVSETSNMTYMGYFNNHPFLFIGFGIGVTVIIGFLSYSIILNKNPLDFLLP